MSTDFIMCSLYLNYVVLTQLPLVREFKQYALYSFIYKLMLRGICVLAGLHYYLRVVKTS